MFSPTIGRIYTTLHLSLPSSSMYYSLITATNYIAKQLGYFYDPELIDKYAIANIILDDIITDMIEQNIVTDAIADQCEATGGNPAKIDEVLQTIPEYQVSLQSAVSRYCSQMISIEDIIASQQTDEQSTTTV